MTTHTPGPWTVGERLSGSENHRGFTIGDARNQWGLASVHPLDSDGNEGRANARLMAAAPELLGALKRLVSINQEHNEAILAITGRPPAWNDSYLNEARAAIAKAEGQPS